MNKFDKRNLKTIREDVNAALASVAAKHGLTLNLGNISFDETSFTGKLQATVKSAGTPEEVNFKKYAELFGLKAEDYGKTFVSNGEKFTLCDIKPRSYKYPFIGKNAVGQRFKFGQSITAKLV